MTDTTSRRDFLRNSAFAGAGGAFVLAFGGKPLRAMAARANDLEHFTQAFQPSAWLYIYEDGSVTIISHRSEMGQGIRTTLPTVLADELGADWSRVKVVQGDGDVKRYGDQNTDGSASLRHQFSAMRQLGASARQMLEGAAAAQWNVPVSDVTARDHSVVHVSTGRTLGFGALALAAAKQPVPEKASLRLKSSKDFRYIGKHVPGVDLRDITTGRATYGQDVSLPGMRVAVIARPPVYGAIAGAVNDSAALKVSGVEHIIRLKGTPPPSGFSPLGGIAVVARNTYAAMKGRDMLQITWSGGDAHGGYDSVAYRAELMNAVRAPATVVRNEGDVDAALRSAAKVVRADYYAPHLAHAVMEPPAALANVRDGSCEIWACTQSPQDARDEVAKALGMPVDQVTVHVTLIGGGFGRKSKPDFIVEAALLSREIGAPVKVVWTREDEIRHGFYHTVCAQHLEAALDASGRPTAWLHRTAFPAIGQTFGAPPNAPSSGELSMGITDMPFDVPNVRCESAGKPAHVRIGWFRSVSNVPHAFAVQSFVDELAHAAGRDPREYMLDLIGSPRHLTIATTGGVKVENYGDSLEQYPIDTARLSNVLRVATEKANWGRTLPAGTGLGLAVHRSFLSYVAAVIEARVGADGTVHVPSVHIAVDCGLAANPDRIRAQMEGAVVMGMSLALFSEITFKDGKAVQGNFNDYRVVRMNESVHETHVHIVESDAPPGGVGEPGLPPIAPALCNAIFAATGKRIRELPVGRQLA